MTTSADRKPRGRRDLLVSLGVVVAVVACVVAGGLLLDPAQMRPSAGAPLSPPSLRHLFGTDHLGRDMFTRTVHGLSLSLAIGVLTAAVSTVISAVLGICAALFGRWVDGLVSWVIDLSIGIPHLIFMVLLAFVVGGGIPGIVLGIALTHWMSLALLVRADVRQIRSAEFMLVSRGLGRSPLFIAWRHVTPLILPQLLVGFVLMFPHVILHEAALTFLGFGFSPQTPAIGILLSEGMPHISSGMWWLAVFPGLTLLLVVLAIARLGDRIRTVLDPATSHG
ncbi:peptide ABC transporter permease [Acrocarpospora phusangensis]|uniref:Peptide ABC transporter permease n=1 Tax=Acrocarpospora phusangensis TaxID=1070424 RepID=A0A919UQI2_9ACTN|nr:ABC transporter permease [Acrocarpospora phusangensis]GIH24590.1 peptide ABC transporter permease [Acrocarpospora phusangensis]